LFSAETALEPLPEGSVGEKYVKDLLGPARPPRMLTNLMERLTKQQGRGLRGEN
jgi:hypothetical protein